MIEPLVWNNYLFFCNNDFVAINGREKKRVILYGAERGGEFWFDPKKELKKLYRKSGYANAWALRIEVESIDKDKLLVWAHDLAEGNIYDRNLKKLKTFKIIPEKDLKGAIPSIKEDIRRIKKASKYTGLTILSINMFVDKDDDGYFYLMLAGVEINKKLHRCMYKFDLNAKLKKVYIVETDKKNSGIDIKYKRNNLFYGTDNERIFIFKEEKNDKKQ